MIVDPYRRFPLPPQVGLLVPDERRGAVVRDEQGAVHAPDDLPDGLRVWASYDVVHDLVAAGVGEALCWNQEEIRWRHDRLDRAGWTNRPSDVAVLKLPFGEEPREALQALGMWRDWLASYGASPTGTTGSAAWSLLRARLQQRLWTTQPREQLPPIAWTLGGRQQLGPEGPGRRQGRLELWDMPAAYARELGHVSYGGSWATAAMLPKRPLDAGWWAQSGRPTFARVRIVVPDMPIGPLPRRPRQHLRGMAAAFLDAEYPVGCRLQGCWTWQEIEAALEAGCRLERVLQVWVHFSNGQPFLRWWDAVERGRTMPGLAGMLAKTTGNALWGRFCMDSTGGVRTIRGREQGRLVQRPVASHGGIPAAHDLAETVSGRVRARLYRAMREAGPRLCSAHTDGVWVREGEPPTGDWRRKARARRLDLLSPQTIRYWPLRAHPDEPFHVFAGVPPEHAPRVFEELWREHGYPPTFDFAHAPTAVEAA